ncbi:hypothetical protein [Photobacterium leiognathi]|uniref:hypothetical protein n=1 Tax=Photobacterium leiognathi TaxID=553611 RepID=UPI002980B689|nr:hypothetical protein [Photobacterium leiognathi]
MLLCDKCGNELTVSNTRGSTDKPRCLNPKCGEKCPKCGSDKSTAITLDYAKCSSCGEFF